MGAIRLRLMFEGLPAAFRRGIEGAAADAGLVADDGRSVFITALDDDPGSCVRIDRLAADGPVVALVDPVEPATIAHAVAHGAGFAGLHSEPEQIVAAAIAALDGATLVPIGLLKHLVGPGPHRTVALSSEESHWLIALAGGGTVVRLADDFGYSERGMFRRLHELYTRLGVANRAEALVEAERRGLLRRNHTG